MVSTSQIVTSFKFIILSQSHIIKVCKELVSQSETKVGQELTGMGCDSVTLSHGDDAERRPHGASLSPVSMTEVRRQFASVRASLTCVGFCVNAGGTVVQAIVNLKVYGLL